MMKDGAEQVKLTTEDKPESTGYIQNEEQNKEGKIWKNIRSKDE